MRCSGGNHLGEGAIFWHFCDTTLVWLYGGEIRDFHTLAVINHRCDRELMKYVVEIKSEIEIDMRL